MKTLENIEDLKKLLASHPIYTYDYADGLLINDGSSLMTLPNISKFTKSR